MFVHELLGLIIMAKYNIVEEYVADNKPLSYLSNMV